AEPQGERKRLDQMQVINDSVAPVPVPGSLTCIVYPRCIETVLAVMHGGWATCALHRAPFVCLMDWLAPRMPDARALPTKIDSVGHELKCRRSFHYCCG